MNKTRVPSSRMCVGRDGPMHASYVERGWGQKWSYFLSFIDYATVHLLAQSFRQSNNTTRSGHERESLKIENAVHEERSIIEASTILDHNTEIVTTPLIIL